jgi:hypothetical protein
MPALGSRVACMGVLIVTPIPSTSSDSGKWLPISMPPPDGEDLEICVMDYDEIIVPLPYPCRRSGADLVDPSNKRRNDIQPTHWRKWTERRAKGV